MKRGEKKNNEQSSPSHRLDVLVFKGKNAEPFQRTIHGARNGLSQHRATCYSAIVFACFFLPPQPSGPSTVNNRHTHPRGTAAVDPEPCLPLARYHPSSVGLYKYTIVLILYLFHLQRSSFCSRVSSFYILAASAKQLMCAECVDSNCLAIVAPSRSRLVLFPPPCDERDAAALDHRARVHEPRGVLPFDSSLISR